MARSIEDILKKFIRHVVGLSMEEDSKGSGFHREFRMLRDIQIEYKKDGKYPTEHGRREENMPKNRYKDILPRDDTRVKLTEIPGEKGSDYINASFIDDVDGNKGYIASQGPMPHTVNDFWRMLWQYKTEIVFMACRVMEDGKFKCEQYWAEKGQSKTFGDITVHTVSEEEVQEHFVKRQLRVKNAGETGVYKVTQFQYLGWPDHNTPSSPDALRCMIEEVRDTRKKLHIPMVVHCSAGCGRTGTICAIDYAWTLLDKGMVTREFSMFDIIRSIREQRMSMVQTPDQYEYTHMVMKSLCNEWLVTFCKSDYENVTIGGQTSETQDENYYNVEFGEDQNNGRESSDTSKERLTIITNTPKGASRPVSNSKPEVKKQKPEITKQKPDITRPKPDTKQKPLGNRAAQGQPDIRAQDKTNIRRSGDSLMPKGIKTGSASVGHRATRHQASRPTAEQAFAQQQQFDTNAELYSCVSMDRKVNRKDQNFAATDDNSIATSTGQMVPDLPTRRYTAEEIESDRKSSSSAKSGDRHSYDNILVSASSSSQPVVSNQSAPRSGKQRQMKWNQTVAARGVRTHPKHPDVPPPLPPQQDDETSVVRHEHIDSSATNILTRGLETLGKVFNIRRHSMKVDSVEQSLSLASPRKVLASDAGKFWMERTPRVAGPRPLPKQWTTDS